MLNKEEVKYNVASLISTWLYGTNEASDLILILTNNNVEATIECDSLDDVVSHLSNVLIDNVEKYTKATLIGIIGENDKKFGELDII